MAAVCKRVVERRRRKTDDIGGPKIRYNALSAEGAADSHGFRVLQSDMPASPVRFAGIDDADTHLAQFPIHHSHKKIRASQRFTPYRVHTGLREQFQCPLQGSHAQNVGRTNL